MANITLFSPNQPNPPQINPNNYPDFLNQFAPTVEPNVIDPDQINMANVGETKVVIPAQSKTELKISGEGVLDPSPDRNHNYHRRTFEPVHLHKTHGPLVIYEKRWYFRLVQGKKDDYKRARALMDDYNLDELSKHMVVCFTPDRIPGQTRLFRTKEGNPGRIYAYFDSYLEFYDYMQRFQPNERAFYEVIFGELPQKPHFDIDIDRADFQEFFPNDNIDETAETLREAVISGCIEVLAGNLVTFDLTRDLLLYSSHGPDKRSYHVIINNKCHDGNKEARAFYDAVMTKIHAITGNKYIRTNFIDKGVYNPRQQFRLVGCQKHGSNRPKIFYEQFSYQGNVYTHIYPEDVTELIMKKLTIIYESMISFTSGCTYLPSLVPAKPVNYNALGDLPDLEQGIVTQCLAMLHNKMNHCPFSYKEVRGHYIILNRDAPSVCPICKKRHDKEHPYMFLLNGKVYWDCRRSVEYAEGKKLFLGYLAMTIEEMQNGAIMPGININDDDLDDQGGELMFGDYNMGTPTLPPIKRNTPPINNETIVNNKTLAEVKTVPERRQAIQPQMELETKRIEGGVTIYIPPPEQRRQNIHQDVCKIGKAWAEKKYIRREPEDLTGVRTLGSVTAHMPWTTGLSGK
ncbi:Origin of replication binding protein [uncultured virus]|nr:Origin of replication binding protein [uncultured virus]